jgi:predicted ATPase
MHGHGSRIAARATGSDADEQPFDHLPGRILRLRYLRAYLQDKHMLLVLDNCEHVLEQLSCTYAFWGRVCAAHLH